MDDEIFEMKPPRDSVVKRRSTDTAEPIINFYNVAKLSETEFNLLHKEDTEKNIRMVLRVTGSDPEDFVWDGLHPDFVCDTEGMNQFSKAFQRSNPDVFLRCLLNRCLSHIQELRPWSEYETLLSNEQYKERLL